MADRPYSRVYWELLDDPKFETIRADVRHLGTWTLMLLVADMAFPAPAFLPPAPKASVQALADAGLVELLSGGRFRLHGLQAERSRRSAIASLGAAARWSDRTPNAMQTHSERNANGMPSRDETRRDEDKPRQDETSIAPADDPVDALYVRTGRYPAGKVKEWAVDLGQRHGDAKVAALIRATPMNGPDVRQYLTAITDTLRAEEHAAERAELVAEKQRNEAKRAPLPDEPWRALHRRAIAAQYGKTEAGA